MASSSSSGDGFEKLRKRLEDLSKYHVQVGWPSQAVHQNGRKIVDIAIEQEYGSPKGTPPRPFMRAAISQNKHKWLNYLGEGARANLQNTNSVPSAFEKAAHLAKTDIENSIRTVSKPPPKTTSTNANKQKTSTTLLDENNQLISTLTYVVEQKT